MPNVTQNLSLDASLPLLLNRLVGYPIFQTMYDVVICYAKTSNISMTEAMMIYIYEGGTTSTMITKLPIPVFSLYDGMHLVSPTKKNFHLDSISALLMKYPNRFSYICSSLSCKNLLLRIRSVQLFDS